LLGTEIASRRHQAPARRSLIEFIRRVWPWFVVEEIHLLIAGYLEALVRGEIDRLMIFMPPRAGKSMLASIILPGWYMGLHAERKVMQASYGAELAVGFGRQVRALVGDEDYQAVFPGVSLQPDNKAAGRWALSKGGEYFATGVTGGIAGKGFNLGIIDDPLSEQDAYSAVAKKRVQDWYGPGFYTRRQPEASAILYMATRWAKDDLAGHLLSRAAEDRSADRWTMLSIPAVVDAEAAEKLNSVASDPLLSPTPTGRPLRFKAGDSFAPRRWPLKEILRQRANMSALAWQALYQQKPVQDEGNILKRKWWRRLTNAEFEELRKSDIKYVVQVYDTAFEESETSDYSARTTWGVFLHQDSQRIVRHCCVLLEAWRGRVGFPDLRVEAVKAFKDYEPDSVLVEKKASGHSLIQELRRAGVPVLAVPAERDKVARAHAAQVVLEQGCVFHLDRTWVQPVVDECADFPLGEHDDWTDTCVHAWLWLRRTMWVELGDEPNVGEDHEEQEMQDPIQIFG
jgi:predicted phage terminase large subunit-like protein